MLHGGRLRRQLGAGCLSGTPAKVAGAGLSRESFRGPGGRLGRWVWLEGAPVGMALFYFVIVHARLLLWVQRRVMSSADCGDCD